MKSLIPPTIAFSLALILSTCDPKTAKEFAKALLTEPEPGLSRLDTRKPEEVRNSPEGAPFAAKERR